MKHHRLTAAFAVVGAVLCSGGVSAQCPTGYVAIGCPPPPLRPGTVVASGPPPAPQQAPPAPLTLNRFPVRGDALDDWCKTARLPSSIAICSEPELRALAVERQQAYDEARARLTPGQQKALLTDQNGWVKTYPQACGLVSNAAPSLPLAPQVKDCMAQAGRARIAYLRAYAGQAPAQAAAPPAPTPGPSSAQRGGPATQLAAPVPCYMNSAESAMFENWEFIHRALSLEEKIIKYKEYIERATNNLRKGPHPWEKRSEFECFENSIINKSIADIAILEEMKEQQAARVPATQSDLELFRAEPAARQREELLVNEKAGDSSRRWQLRNLSGGSAYESIISNARLAEENAQLDTEMATVARKYGDEAGAKRWEANALREATEAAAARREANNFPH